MRVGRSRQPASRAPGTSLTIELLKPHTHAGIAYPPGAAITLDADLAMWLITAGIARVRTPPALQKPSARSEESAP